MYSGYARRIRIRFKVEYARLAAPELGTAEGNRLEQRMSWCAGWTRAFVGDVCTEERTARDAP